MSEENEKQETRKKHEREKKDDVSQDSKSG